MSAIGLLNDADLHGLVDGHVEAGRRADVLRRLAASPADRARVEAWQDQNDLIKSAFFGVDKESIPVTLRLVAPPSLHCVPASEPALVDDTAHQAVPLRERVFSTLIGTLLIAAGVGGGWMLIQPTEDRSQVIDVSLAQLGDDGVTASIPSENAHLARPAALATSTIPNLSSSGFVFTSAEALATKPSTLVFHYRNAASDQVNVQVDPSPDARYDAAPSRSGQSFIWRAGHKLFSLSGALRPDQLRALATRLLTER